MHVSADRLDWEDVDTEEADEGTGQDAQPFSGQLISYEGFPLQITRERGLQASVFCGQDLVEEEEDLEEVEVEEEETQRRRSI